MWRRHALICRAPPRSAAVSNVPLMAQIMMGRDMVSTYVNFKRDFGLGYAYHVLNPLLSAVNFLFVPPVLRSSLGLCQTIVLSMAGVLVARSSVRPVVKAGFDLDDALDDVVDDQLRFGGLIPDGIELEVDDDDDDDDEYNDEEDGEGKAGQRYGAADDGWRSRGRRQHAAGGDGDGDSDDDMLVPVKPPKSDSDDGWL